MNYKEYTKKAKDLEDAAAYAFIDMCEWIVAGRPVSAARLWYNVQVASKEYDNLVRDYINCLRGRRTE